MNARVNRPAMGTATETSHNNKALYRKLLDSFAMNKVEAAVSSLFHESAKVHASHPINEAHDGDGYLHNIIAPIFASFEGLYPTKLHRAWGRIPWFRMGDLDRVFPRTFLQAVFWHPRQW